MHRALHLITAMVAISLCQCGDSRPAATGQHPGTTGATTGGSGGAGSGGKGGDPPLFETGGAGGSAPQTGCIEGLQSLSLSPENATLVLDGGTPEPVTLAATGTLLGGGQFPVQGNRLAWTVSRKDDTPPGSISAGVLHPYPSAGGTVTVQATDGCVTGSTDVTFLLEVTLDEPPDPGLWAGVPVVGPGAPEIVYPSSGTVFPRNLFRTIFQWRSQGLGSFRLVFEGPHSTLTTYTDGAHGLCAAAAPPAGCWEVNELAWGFIAGSNAGETATLHVDALDPSTSPPTVRRSEPIELGFSKRDVLGALFYWSTTSAGIRRGRMSQLDPEDYLVGNPGGTVYGNDQVNCVACHVVSRDGKYMAAPVESNHTNSLWVLELTETPPPAPVLTSVDHTQSHGFATFSPDNERLVVAWQDKMWMIDRATGAPLGDVPTGTYEGTHPDWSPTGKELVFATGHGDAPHGSSLAKVAYHDGVFDLVTILSSPPTGMSNLFPMFSPEGDYIAFTQGKGGHGDPKAQLFVIDRDAQAPPVELVRANRIVNNELTNGLHQNTAPTWAPPGGDHHWLAFNSKRAYGVIRPQGTQQIWVAAIDPEKLPNGEDPSYPAFRVPFQGLDENNHRAYWTPDHAGTGGAGGTGGTGGAGGSGGCSEILTIGEPCQPGLDCCETGSLCDTSDDGATYTCESPPQ